MLQPDTVRGTPLDMDQYTRLFGTARIPTEVSPSPDLHSATRLTASSPQRGCRMESHSEARHIVILRRGQFCACIMLLANYIMPDIDPVLSQRTQIGSTCLTKTIGPYLPSARS